MRRPNQLQTSNMNCCDPESTVSLIEALNDKKIKIGFRIFLESEFSVENLDFWLAVEEYKKIKNKDSRQDRMREIFEEYVSSGAPNQINLDHFNRQQLNMHLITEDEPCIDAFTGAQRYVFNIMENDSYARFVRSKYFDVCSSPGRRSPRQFLQDIFTSGKSRERSLPSSRKGLAESFPNENNNNSSEQKRLHGSDGNISGLDCQQVQNKSTETRRKSSRAKSEPALSDLRVFRSLFSKRKSK